MPSKHVKKEKMRSPDQEQKSERLFFDENRVLNAYEEDTDVCDGVYQSWDLKRYCNGIQIEVVREFDEQMTLEFDLINVDAAVANAIRRILIAEVPTVAIEKIYLYQNTSIIQDEVLSHRMGLIPIRVDPRQFEMGTGIVPEYSSPLACHQEPVPDEKHAIVFELNVHGVKQPAVSQPNTPVYTKQLKWVPVGTQPDTLKPLPEPVHGDILIAKLRPGQQIHMRCHCYKGIGRDHAKFSPVATAAYRMLPTVVLKRDVLNEDADLMQQCFSKGVIDVVEDESGTRRARVVDARRDMCSRNVFRHKHLADAVEMGRMKRHFIFSVESTGALPAAQLVLEACAVMRSKCAVLKKLVPLPDPVKAL